LVVSHGDRTGTSIPQAVSGGYDPIIGNFAGDDHDDIFWYAPNDPARFPDSIWISNGDGTWVKKSLNIRGEYQPFVGDFDSDGHDSLFWYAPGTGPDSLWTFTDSGGHTSRTVTVNGFYHPVVGDFADGTGGFLGQDIVWKSSGSASPLWTAAATTTGFSSRTVAIPGTASVTVGPFGGGAHDDLLAVSPGSGPDRVMYGPFGPSDFDSIAVAGTYRPIVGEFNGDGFYDIVWDTATGAPDPLWLGAGQGTFDRAGTVDLEPSSSVHIVQVGYLADPGVVVTDDIVVIAGSEGSPTNGFQVYYGISEE
jgi:hypothetical protein